VNDDTGETTGDILSDFSDLRLMQLLLADLHDDLPERVRRFRYLTDLSGALGQGGTMIFGGTPAYAAFSEARSSFVNGNFVATIVLCQSLVESLLAAFLHAGIMDELPPRIAFDETLKRCHSQGILSDTDVVDLKKLATLRNPLTHFRHLEDKQHPDRRAMEEQSSGADILRKDAYFAVGLAVRMLAKPPFRFG
jgi:hypothetical protein